MALLQPIQIDSSMREDNLHSHGGTTGMPTPIEHDRKITLLTTSFNNDEVEYSDNE